MAEKQRTPTRKDSGHAERKIIIGVPVLPGLPLQSETTLRVDGSDSDSLGSNQYDAIPHPTPDVTANTNAASMEPKWKLQHIDFIPNVVKGKTEDFERFAVLLDRANEWSQGNPQAAIFGCETVQWMTMDRPIFTDAGVQQKSMHGDKKTRVIRGLRLWYLILEETFFDRADKARCPGPFRLAYANYVPEGKNDNMGNMLKKLNEDLFKKGIPGRRVLRVETIHQLSDCADADMSSWREEPEKNKDYYTFFRVFFMIRTEEPISHSDIAIRDFFPNFDQRSPHSQGYEVFGDVWSRAARWVYMNPQISVINFQSVFIKIKKDTDGLTNFFDRCFYREHGSAYGAMGHNRTDYVQILRVIHTQNVQQRPDTIQPKMLFQKHFAPIRMRKGMETQSGEDAEPLENLFEDLRHMEQKMNAWLSFSGAVIFGVETIPTRLNTGGQETIGPEATFCYNDREKNQGREYWKVNVRLYIDGRFREVPVQWCTRIVEERQTKSS